MTVSRASSSRLPARISARMRSSAAAISSAAASTLSLCSWGITTTFAVQAIWQLLNDFRERGPVALAERAAQARNSKWGVIDTKRLVGSEEIRALEDQFLPSGSLRDYDGTWGHRITFQREGASAPEKK